jgi:hypothetical protein
MVWRISATIFVAIVSVVLPLTVNPSTMALVVLWSAAGLAFVGMVVTSPPVANRVWEGVAERVGDRAVSPQPSSRRPSLKAVFSQVAEELEHCRDVLSEQNRYFFRDHQLPVHRWEQYGPSLAGMPKLHKVVREAYREIDAINRSIHFRDYPSGPYPEVNEERVARSKPIIDRAITELDTYAALPGA